MSDRVHGCYVTSMSKNDQAPPSAPLVSELYDAEVVEFLPLFAFRAMKCDEEPAKLCVQSG